MKKIYQESGITLISLIITIVILVVLATVSMSVINKDEDIINSAYGASDDYNKINYQEQVYQLTESIIKEYELSGREVSLSEIVQEMAKQDWIANATVDSNAIFVTINEYIYQVYYNDQFGQRFVEFIGKDEGGNFPTIVATYNSETQNIVVSSVDAQRIELMFNGKTVKTSNSTSLNYTAQDTGLYIAKAISNSGKIKYAWVMASIQDVHISLDITSVGVRNNGWYGKDNVPVQVTISTNGSDIYYKLGAAANYTHIESNTQTISINTVGTTKVYAYAVDSSGRQSDVSSITIKYDNTRPQIGEIVIEGEKGAGDVYTSDIVISLSNMSDTGSGIEGYSYWVLNGSESNEIYIQGNRSITVSSEGTKRIVFQVKDKAGNLSDMQMITVEKQ